MKVVHFAAISIVLNGAFDKQAAEAAALGDEACALEFLTEDKTLFRFKTEADLVDCFRRLMQ